MEKWTYAIGGALVVACIVGAQADEPRPSREPSGLSFHVRTAHCQVAGRLSPIRLKFVCA
jgi:hypothetical protein